MTKFKTVTACHAEIDRLQKLVSSLERRTEDLSAELDKANKALDEIEEEETARGDGAASAINAFLDECERTGPQRFDVPQSDRVNRAIVALHDVVGRNP